ncbi:response regulator [Occallatibacter savannae]|uniref:response regulator n=1 Tax=Occallatibacter savannae TaxID=1002691 RepID=UPI000D6892E8|nr:response regulator transcription factor [Occallatibacter savannae]
MNKSVMIADDHTLMLEGLARLLSTEFEVVGTAPNGRALLEQAQQLKPDVVVLDVGMPELNGIETAHRLVKMLPSVKIVFVTQQLAPAYLHAAFAAGAKAYVAKQSATNELISAIKMALEDRFYVTPHAGAEAARLSSLHPKQNPAEMFGTKLTPRQREVLQLVAEGKSTKQISASLGISPKTVEFHRNSLMDELGLRSIAELTRFAVSQGIVNS